MIAGAATGFRPLDWAVVVLFLLWMLWIGYRSGRLANASGSSAATARGRVRSFRCWAAAR